MEPEELYGLPLERFTDERNALAKGLRKEGRRDEAAEVSKLRKPSVAAWAVNQLVRTQRRDIAALFAAGDALREAQSSLLAGRGEADTLRDAVESERTAVDELTRKAQGLLSSEGHELTSATLERVSETLNAAALDEDLRAQVRGGCLERELHHIGIGGLGTAAPPRSGRGGKASPKKPASRTRHQDARPKQTRGAEAVVTRKAEADARRRADRSAKELKAAQARRDRAAAEFRNAQEKLRDAEDVLGSAKRAAADAAGELEALRQGRGRR
jgi:hypothetical protein